jgi:hypothetical protein
MTDETKQTEPPIAPGLDAWWQNGPAVDKAAAEEAAVLAEDFQAERMARYLESGGADDSGGFVQPTLVRSRMIDWMAMPRGTVWR